MLNPRWRKIIRDLWGNKTRTLLVVMSIAVGVFAVGVIVSTQMLLSQDLDADYSATEPSSAILVIPRGFDQDLVETVENMPGVRLAEGRRSVSVRLRVGPDNWKDFNLDVIDRFDKQKLNKVRSMSGAWPPANKEVLVERASIGLTNAQVGDKVTIELTDGKTRELTLSGIAHDLNKPPAAFVGEPYGYINMDTLEWLGFNRNFDSLSIVVAENERDRKHVESVAEEVKKKIEKGGQEVAFIWIPTPGKHPADDAVQPMLLILGVLGALSLFLSAFLVINTISALMAQQVRQIGIMKAVGARRGQIAHLYLGMVLIFGLLSLLVAIPLGALGAFAFTQYLASLINFDMQGYRIPTQSLLLQIGVGLFVPILASLAPILSGARITVREALTSYGIGGSAFGTSRIDRLVEQIRGLSRPTLISLRNTFRRKARLALTLFTLTLGGAIFIAVLTVHSSLLNTLSEFFNYWNYDVAVNFTRPYRADVVTREALAAPGVVEAEVWGLARGGRVRANGDEGRTLTIVGVPPDTRLLNPTLLQGRWLLPDDENALVINTAVTQGDMEPDIKLGDEVTFKIDGRDTTWRVVGVAQAVLTGPIMYANRGYVNHITGNVDRASSVQVITQQHDLAYQVQMAETLKDHYKNVGINVNGTQTIGQIRQNIEYQFNLIVVFLTIMAVLLALVGGLGLMGTMSINVLERTREIGVLRAIGASDGAVLRVFLVEGIFIGLISWVLGALFSLPISRLLSDAVGIAFLKAPLAYVFNLNGALLWLGIVLALATLASWLPSWKASRLTVRDVLAYE